MARYYYLVSYDFTVEDSEILGGHILLGRHNKISQSENPAGEIARIINDIRSDIWRDYRGDNKTQRDDIRIVLRAVQLIE